ncbi:uncharacterized protein METZ01_LOCUS492011 [marine metagenome]|uniref:Uncharacterized protein n=1 Tax=marine metagenome TaxID=408172 RepID=A0A383D3N4_9ZZZZ
MKFQLICIPIQSTLFRALTSGLITGKQKIGKMLTKKLSKILSSGKDWMNLIRNFL